MFGRRKRDEAEPQTDETADPADDGGRDDDREDAVAESDLRAEGPWDLSEREPDEEYLPLGALLVRGREGLAFQLPTDNGQVMAVVVATDDSAMELRAFAASRSGGEWTSLSAEIADEVTRSGGTWAAEDGPFGTELRAEVPMVDEEGNAQGLQSSRMIGIEGPRWLLRATVFGAAAQPDGDDELMLKVLRDVIVQRGGEPRIVGEALPLAMPPGVEMSGPEDPSLD